MELHPLFEDAARLTVKYGFGSPTYLEQRLKLSGYQAFDLLDQMEQAGIVGPMLARPFRDVLIQNEEDLEVLLEAIKAF